MSTDHKILFFALIKKVPLFISLGTCIKKNIVQSNYKFSFKFPIKYPKSTQNIQILQTALETKNKTLLMPKHRETATNYHAKRRNKVADLKISLFTEKVIYLKDVVLNVEE